MILLIRYVGVLPLYNLVRFHEDGMEELVLANPVDDAQVKGLYEELTGERWTLGKLEEARKAERQAAHRRAMAESARVLEEERAQSPFLRGTRFRRA